MTVSNAFGVVPNLSRLGPITSAYSFLMSLRNVQLSALQRRLTLLAYHGGANDRVSSKYSIIWFKFNPLDYIWTNFPWSTLYNHTKITIS